MNLIKKCTDLCKKYRKLFITFLGLSAISIISTLKGYILSQCGYNYEFWLAESISLLITISLLFYLWNIIHEGYCVTIKKNK